MSSLRIIFDHFKEKGGGVIYIATSEKNKFKLSYICVINGVEDDFGEMTLFLCNGDDF
jgi:hypothetical protein